MGDYKAALEYSNKLLNSDLLKTNVQLQGWTKIISLVILFELGEYRYVSRQLKSLKSYFKKNKQFPRYESLALESLRALIADETNKQPAKTLSDILKRFSALRTGGTEATRFLEFEFDWWIESKIKKVPFRDIVRFHRLAKAIQVKNVT